MTINHDHRCGHRDDVASPCLPAGPPVASRDLQACAGGDSSAIGPVGASLDGVLDELLDQLQRRRQRATAGELTAQRAGRVARLYEQEARVWSLLFERSRSRIHWRAALSAEVYARSCARAWRARAAAAHHSNGSQYGVHEGEWAR